MEPRQLCSNLLHKFLVGPDLGETPHILEVAGREAFHVGKLVLQVRRQAIDHLSAPAFPRLPIEDVAADLPIEQDQFSVNGERGAQLRRLNPALQVCKELRVAVVRERSHSRLTLYCRLLR